MSGPGSDSLCGIVLAAGYSSRMRGKLKPLLPFGKSSMLGTAVGVLHAGGVERVCVVTGNECEAVAEEALRHGAVPVHNPAFAEGMFSSIRAGLAYWAETSRQLLGAVFLLPVDAALVRSHSIAAIRRTWKDIEPEQRPGAVIIPAFSGKTGHPPLLGAAHILPVLQGALPGGLRDYLAGLLTPRDAEAFLAKAPVTVCSLEEEPEFDPLADQGKGRKGKAPTEAATPFTLVAAGAKNLLKPVYYLPLPDAGIISDLDTPGDYDRAGAFLDFTRDRRSPAPVEAWEWLRNAGLGKRKMRHCLKVSLGALRLGLALQRAGRQTDLFLHVCGGMLHDIARTRRNHTSAGQAMVCAQGWPDCALVVGAHTVLPDACLEALGLPLRDVPQESKAERLRLLGRRSLTGAAVSAHYAEAGPKLLHACACVYMADKYFYGDEQVGIADRFTVVKDHFRHDAEALEAISHREHIALALRGWFTEILGETPEAVIAVEGAHPLENFLYRLLAETGE